MPAGFKILSDKDATALKTSGRSNVSAPIVNSFIEATEGRIGAVAEVDATQFPGNRKPDSLYQMLNQHALTNGLPVRGFMRDKKVYLERLETARPKPVARPKAETVVEASTPGMDEYEAV